MPVRGADRLGPLARHACAIAILVFLVSLPSVLAGCDSGATPASEREAAVAVSSSLPTAVADVPGVTPSLAATPIDIPTPTLPPSYTLTPTASATLALPTATPPASATPPPTDEPTPTATVPIYDAAYVADVTIPDGTVMEPGAPFTKTWRLRNAGNVPWEEDTVLQLAAGEAMGAPEAVPVPATAPGEVVEVSVPLVAPTEAGQHSAAWRLCRAGACFGGAVTLQIVSQAAQVAGSPAVEAGLPPAEAVECNYIGNRNPTSMKFHRADCRWVKEMYEGNKVCFATREEAIAAGYVPCKVCKP